MIQHHVTMTRRAAIGRWSSMRATSTYLAPTSVHDTPSLERCSLGNARPIRLQPAEGT